MSNNMFAGATMYFKNKGQMLTFFQRRFRLFLLIICQRNKLVAAIHQPQRHLLGCQRIHRHLFMIASYRTNPMLFQ